MLRSEPTWTLSGSAQFVCPLPVHCPALGAEDDKPVQRPASLIQDPAHLKAVCPLKEREAQ